MRTGINARLEDLNLTQAPPPPEGACRELADAYREDILKLQELISRDLSVWLGNRAATELSAG
jgi:hypothetical protein